jgi:hypothetical protein
MSGLPEAGYQGARKVFDVRSKKRREIAKIQAQAGCVIATASYPGPQLKQQSYWNMFNSVLMLEVASRFSERHQSRPSGHLPREQRRDHNTTTSSGRVFWPRPPAITAAAMF